MFSRSNFLGVGIRDKYFIAIDGYCEESHLQLCLAVEDLLNGDGDE